MKNEYYIAFLTIIALAYFVFTYTSLGSADDALSYLSEAKVKPAALFFESDGHLRIDVDEDNYKLFEFKGDEFTEMVKQLAFNGWKYEKLFTTKHWGTVGLLYWQNYPPWEVKFIQKNADEAASNINRIIWKYKLKQTGSYFGYSVCVFAFAYLVQLLDEHPEAVKLDRIRRKAGL
jgi:hypothetical protein